MAPNVKSAQLVVPYYHVPVTRRADASGMISQTLPMAAMFLRNKMLSWSALFLSVQAYLNEPINKPQDEESSAQPASLKVVFALISLVTCYMELILPTVAPAAVKNVAEVSSVTSSILSAATSS